MNDTTATTHVLTFKEDYLVIPLRPGRCLLEVAASIRSLGTGPVIYKLAPNRHRQGTDPVVRKLTQGHYDKIVQDLEDELGAAT